MAATVSLQRIGHSSRCTYGAEEFFSTALAFVRKSPSYKTLLPEPAIMFVAEAGQRFRQVNRSKSSRLNFFL